MRPVLINEVSKDEANIDVLTINNLIRYGEQRTLGPFNLGHRAVALFESNNGNNIFHILASKGILRGVLPTLLQHAAEIVTREHGALLPGQTALQFIQALLAQPNTKGISPIHYCGVDDVAAILAVNCPSGIFNELPDGSNIVHCWAKKGIVNEALPIMLGNVEAVVVKENLGFRLAGKTAEEFVKGQLLIKNQGGHTPTHIAIWNKSYLDFKILCNIGNVDLTTFDPLAAAVPGSEVPKQTINNISLAEFFFYGERGRDLSDTGVTPMITSAMCDGWVDFFKIIVKEWKFGKFVFEAIDAINGIEQEEYVANTNIQAIYKIIFQEFWSQILLVDGNREAYYQIKSLAAQIGSINKNVFGVKVDELVSVFALEDMEDATEQEIMEAARAKIFAGLADNYKRAQAEQIDAPLSIPVVEIVTAVLDIESEVFHAKPGLLAHIQATSTAISEGVKYDEPVPLPEVVLEPVLVVAEAVVVETLSAEEYMNALHVFITGHKQLKQLVGESVLDTLFKAYNTIKESGFKRAASMVASDQGLLEVEIIGQFLEYIESADQANVAPITTVNFDIVIARPLIKKLIEFNLLKPEYLKDAIKVNNEAVINEALNKMTKINWPYFLEQAIHYGCHTVIDSYAHSDDVVPNVVAGILAQITADSISSYGTEKEEATALARLENAAISFEKLLNSAKIDVTTNDAIEADIFQKFSAIFSTFKSTERTQDYSNLKAILLKIGAIMQGHVSATAEFKALEIFTPEIIVDDETFVAIVGADVDGASEV